jgi:RNA polymerase sigma-70 factor, ECF subfamily
LVAKTRPPDAESATDAEAIGASRTEPERFAEIFHRHFTEIHRYIGRRLGPEIAENVAAETFTVAFHGRHRHDLTRPDARPWLYGIAANLIRQHRRQNGAAASCSPGRTPHGSANRSTSAATTC